MKLSWVVWAGIVVVVLIALCEPLSQTPSRTRSRSKSPTKSVTPSKSHTRTSSPTKSISKTPTRSRSNSRTNSRTPTISKSKSASPSESETASQTPPPSDTPSNTASVTPTTSPSESARPSITRSRAPDGDGDGDGDADGDGDGDGFSQSNTPTSSNSPSSSPSATPSISTLPCNTDGQRYMFVSKQTFMATDLRNKGTIDDVCTEESNAIRTADCGYVALYSTQTTAAKDLLPLHDPRSISSPLGLQIVPNIATLFAAGAGNAYLTRGIDYYADRNAVPINTYVWSGSNQDGTDSLIGCVDTITRWTTVSQSKSSTVGKVGAVDENWLSSINQPCNVRLSVYCIEG